MQKIINYFDHFNPEILYTLFGILLINIGLFLWFWLHNKKKYENLKHQVPPEAVKNYVDSMMQNSSASNSAASEKTQNPSVLPTQNMQGSGNISLDSGSGLENELRSVKNSEISSLREELNSKTNKVGELENKTDNLDLEIEQKNNYIKDLESRLEKSPEGGEDNSNYKGELDSLIKERDELKERLDEYAVIEDDLADLKRYKQENEELRQALGQEPESSISAPTKEEVKVEEKIKIEPEPDSLESLAEALENEEQVEPEEKSIPEDATATEPEANILDQAAGMMDQIVNDDEKEKVEKPVVAAPVKKETVEAEAVNDTKTPLPTDPKGEQALKVATEPEAKIPETKIEGSEETAPAATSKIAEEAVTAESDVKKEEETDEAGEPVAAKADGEAEEEPAVKNEVEEEKSLDDLLNEFEKMLG